jgi:hypothetical protein
MCDLFFRHNASSYGHLDIAALLIKYDTLVNATGEWNFVSSHEFGHQESSGMKEFKNACFDFFFHRSLGLLASPRIRPEGTVLKIDHIDRLYMGPAAYDLSI